MPTDGTTIENHRRALGVSLLIAFLAIAVLLLPRASGDGLSTMTTWGDQSVFLRAVVATDQGVPDAHLRSLVGPAYIALTRVISRIFGLEPAEALVILSRLTFLACATIMATVALRQRARADIVFQVALAAVAVLTLASSVWIHFSDIPWTHFVAAALLAATVLVSLSDLPLPIRSALIGALMIALIQTRLFEAMVASIAAVLIAPLAIVRHWRQLAEQPVAAIRRIVLPSLGGAIVAFVLIGVFSRNWSLYQQYSSETGMVLKPELVPLKAVQLFWDTCFATLCNITAAPTTGLFAETYESWRQPLLLQLPGLAAAAAGLLALLILRPGQALRAPLGVLFAVLAAGGLLLAYVSGAPSGSPHLKYGFFRDFVPAMVLLTTAFIAALATQRADSSRTTVSLALPLVVFLAVVVALVGLRTVGLPRVPNGDVARLEIASSCSTDPCSFALTAYNAANQAVPYDDLAFVVCKAGALPPATLRVSELRIAPSACSSVAIYPVATGLLYTPEGDSFTHNPLDLTLPADGAAVP